MMIYEAKEIENNIQLEIGKDSVLKTEKGTFYLNETGISFKDKNTNKKIIVSVLALESITISDETILSLENDDITFNFKQGSYTADITFDDDISSMSYVLVNDVDLFELFLRKVTFDLGYYNTLYQDVITESISDDTNNNDNTGTENTGTENTGTENTGTENTGTENTGTENTGTENTGTDNTGTENTGTENTNPENNTNP